MKARRGVTLGTTLLLAVLVAALGLCLASASMTHLHLVSGNASTTRALDLARSAMATAIARLQSGHNLPDVQIFDGPDQGLLSFGPAADQWAIPRSLDNLQGDSSLAGYQGRPLPPYSSQLVAVGRSQGAERRVVALVHLPTFPYALASQGPLHSPQGLLVARLTLPGNPASDPAPATMRGNDNLTLGPGSHILGDAIASGDINVPQGSVEGLLRPHEPVEPMAGFDLSRYDPVALGHSFNALASTIPGGPLSGVNRAAHGLRVNGDLNLRDSLLFVQGDLEVTGALEGRGIVVATGDLSLFGHSNLEAVSRVGLLAGGKLKVIGQDQDSNSVRGLLYAGGGLDLRTISVHGVVINGGDQLARFDSASIYYDERASKQSVFLGGEGDNQLTLYVLYPNLQLSEHPSGSSWFRAVIRRTGDDEFRIGETEVFDSGMAVGGHGPSQGDSLDATAGYLHKASDWNGHAPSEDDIRDFLHNRFSAVAVDHDDQQLVITPSEILPLADRFRVTLWEEP